MQISIWRLPQNPHLVRAYINHLPCLMGAAKAYVQPAGDGVVLKVTDPSAREDVLAALVEAGIVEEGQTLDQIPFAAFEARAQASGKRQRRTGKTGGSSPANRAPARTSVGTREHEAEALDLATIPVPDPVVIRIDHREPAALFEALDGLPNVTVERVELALGDIDIQGRETRYVIERKSCTETQSRTDFEASVVDDSKRLFFQSEKLKLEEGITPVIVLEGEVHEHSRGMRVQAIDGMLTFLVALQRMNVVTTYSVHHTAYLALKLAAHDRSGLGYEPPLRGRKPTGVSRTAQLAFVLEGLPGVSANIAKLLAERFGSMAALVAASEADLKGIPGLGAKRIAQLRDILHGA
jgi:ERCC4-type nuclease